MSRWAALPAELDPRVRQLVVRLRRLKDHSGLSLRQLAARTAYSPKSWERYLGGRSLPPREAVEALARVGGEDPTRLLALREVAAQAWGKRHTSGTAPDGPGPEPAATAPHIVSSGMNAAGSAGGWVRAALVAGTVALALSLSTAVMLLIRLGGHAGGDATAPIAASAPASAAPAAPGYTCRAERVDGRWYAGNSRTRDAIVADGRAGPEVAEVQCLLRRAGIAPGAVDGIFGPVTEDAVRRFQERAGLVVDGIVGPHTWKALRR
ncbi:peptidoglycan-binding protein [Streptomyces sp. NPDC007808]|uniref:peptidoglycan-binding protein n=1 Tax=Streptomyces sp. NPDC007808 TaxID=3364779 RepID=UPI0036CF796B